MLPSALILVGGIGLIIGNLWLLIAAFQESIIWGLGTLIVPFVGLFFIILHWDRASKPFLLSLASSLPFVVGMLMSGKLG